MILSQKKNFKYDIKLRKINKLGPQVLAQMMKTVAIVLSDVIIGVQTLTTSFVYIGLQ
jgi:hypothetical protein